MLLLVLAGCALLASARVAVEVEKDIPVYQPEDAADAVLRLRHAIVLYSRPKCPLCDRSRHTLRVLAADYSRIPILEVDCSSEGQFCAAAAARGSETVEVFRNGAPAAPLYMTTGIPHQVAAEAESHVFPLIYPVESLTQAHHDFVDGMRQYGLLGAGEDVSFNPKRFSFGSPEKSSAVRGAGKRSGVPVTPYAAQYFSTLLYATCGNCGALQERLSQYLEDYRAPLRVYITEGVTDTLQAIQEGVHFSMDITDSTTREEVRDFMALHMRPVLPLVTDDSFHFFASVPNKTTLIVVSDAANAENGFQSFYNSLRDALVTGLKGESDEMVVYAEKYAFIIMDAATDRMSLGEADIVPIEMPVLVAYRLTSDGAMFYPMPLSRYDTDRSIPYVIEWMEDMARPLVPLDKLKRREWRLRQEEEARQNKDSHGHDEL